MHRLSAWLRAFVPQPATASRRERWLGVVGAALGLICAEWASRRLLGIANPWFVAPMGASAVLLFAVPASPLAQPWSIIGGNLVAAAVGVTCGLWIGHSGLAAGLAAALAIGVMFGLRCVHPPAGAVALTAVLGGADIARLGYGFVELVALNSAFLLLAALGFNNLFRRRYPHRAAERPNPHLTADPLPSARAGFSRADLNDALAARGELLDVSTDDLREILTDAELRAQRRRFGDTRCADIMAHDIVRVSPEMTVADAWRLLKRHQVKALPVATADRRLVGIVSLHDFFIDRHTHRPLPSPALAGDIRIAAIMTTRVITVRPEQPMVDLVPLFSDGGLHHLPVVDAEHRVVGMITQSDLVAALFRSGFHHVEDRALSAIAA